MISIVPIVKKNMNILLSISTILTTKLLAYASISCLAQTCGDRSNLGCGAKRVVVRRGIRQSVAFRVTCLNSERGQGATRIGDAVCDCLIGGGLCP